MVKTPICLFDLKTGILCSSCEEKLRRGLISELDIEVAKALLKLEETKYRQLLQDVNFHKAYMVEDMLAVLVDQKDVAKLVSKGSKLLKELGDAFGKKVRVLSYRCDLKEFLEELLAPANILALNRVWLPDGSTEVKVVVSYTGKKPPISFETAKALSMAIRGVPLRIEVDKSKRVFRLSRSKKLLKERE